MAETFSQRVRGESLVKRGALTFDQKTKERGEKLLERQEEIGIFIIVF